MMSVSVAGIQKNRCQTTVAERMVETLAELPFIGDQVGLFRAQPGRPPSTLAFRARRRYSLGSLWGLVFWLGSAPYTEVLRSKSWNLSSGKFTPLQSEARRVFYQSSL